MTIKFRDKRESIIGSDNRIRYEGPVAILRDTTNLDEKAYPIELVDEIIEATEKD